MPWMYILACRNGALYVGKANNLHVRIGEHSGKIPTTRHSKFVQRHGFGRLVYFEHFQTESAALEREYALKHWHPMRYAGRKRYTPVRHYKDYLVCWFPSWKLEAFNSTSDDKALKERLTRGISDALPDFQPDGPEAWWAGEQQRKAAGTSDPLRAEQLRQKEEKYREAYPRSKLDEAPKRSWFSANWQLLLMPTIIALVFLFSLLQ